MYVFFFPADFPYNKSASLPGYGRNGIYKVRGNDCEQMQHGRKLSHTMGARISRR